MLLSLLGLVALAQSEAADLGAPPVQIRKTPTCHCPDEIEDGVLFLEGLVVDAEVTLAPDGLSVNERQTTIFDIKRSPSEEIAGRTRVWHSNNPAKCGVTFDYGAKYRIAVRKLEDGSLETDECLMSTVRPEN